MSTKKKAVKKTTARKPAPAPVERAVMVTTEHKGIFVGFTADKADAAIITLRKARCIVYYGAETKGFLGIAAGGVPKNARVSHAVEALSLRNITSVVDATPEAVQAWERAPWC